MPSFRTRGRKSAGALARPVLAGACIAGLLLIVGNGAFGHRTVFLDVARIVVAAGFVIAASHLVWEGVAREVSRHPVAMSIAATALAASLAPTYDLLAGTGNGWTSHELAMRFAIAASIGAIAGTALTRRLRRIGNGAESPTYAVDALHHPCAPCRCLAGDGSFRSADAENGSTPRRNV